ncbi:VOC family protein [Pseudomonas sp. 21615526]|jgi:catechol 2,3-dioxygenase-like lactoylglutathione lyase family enzyme|uniref:VOC family protein n=1 Tax=unclassified Pseudomonas TaxID=196821 RepID=UPI0015A0E90D|nr:MULTISPECIES: VOC family protein [unclassified Pseudomonas]MDQ0668401.1 catechol 2,3-dioxygenase-like lactoylglutathione lyase family enzyme [Pseudomonas sp. W2I6]NVZ41512.1 VOC family protein [Pseudomonas sp. 21615526]NWA33114.1 VOC family protein [Pseudomonas sp. C6002]NWB44053.1 VOC family protein [Pseudomonas sp. E6002]NWB61419.1 VOC family protein [Pseudomonas sp. F1002]
MTVHYLDHFTLRTEHVDATVSFYRDALGLEEGWRPAFPFPGSWLYSAGRPLLHIASLQGSAAQLETYLGVRAAGDGSSALDHIALRCNDLETHRQRLHTLGLPFTERVVPELFEHQLFVEDPNGIRVELIFAYPAA